jgi:hypothetical protein
MQQWLILIQTAGAVLYFAAAISNLATAVVNRAGRNPSIRDDI